MASPLYLVFSFEVTETEEQLEDYRGEVGHVTSEFSTEVATAVSTYSLRNDEKLEGMGGITARITEGFVSIPLRWRPSVFQPLV